MPKQQNKTGEESWGGGLTIKRLVSSGRLAPPSPGHAVPQGRGVHGVRGGDGDAGGAGRAATGSAALLVVVGPAQELGRDVKLVPAPGPTGRKSLPACGGDSLAERALPAPLQIS